MVNRKYLTKLHTTFIPRQDPANQGGSHDQVTAITASLCNFGVKFEAAILKIKAFPVRYYDNMNNVIRSGVQLLRLYIYCNFSVMKSETGSSPVLKQSLQRGILKNVGRNKK